MTTSAQSRDDVRRGLTAAARTAHAAGDWQGSYAGFTAASSLGPLDTEDLAALAIVGGDVERGLAHGRAALRGYLALGRVQALPEERILGVEQRSVRALEQVADTMAVLEKRFNAGPDLAARSA